MNEACPIWIVIASMIKLIMTSSYIEALSSTHRNYFLVITTSPKSSPLIKLLVMCMSLNFILQIICILFIKLQEKVRDEKFHLAVCFLLYFLYNIYSFLEISVGVYQILLLIQKFVELEYNWAFSSTQLAFLLGSCLPPKGLEDMFNVLNESIFVVV